MRKRDWKELANNMDRSPDIEFVQVKPGDWKKIQSIAYATWPKAFGEVLTKEQIDYMLKLIYNEDSLRNQMTVSGHLFILVYEGIEPVGFASYEANYHSLPQLIVHKLYLLPQTQGKGIGTILIRYLTDVAIKNNNNKLRLKVYYKNHRAIEFYRKNGFSDIGTETTSIGNDYNIIDNLMTKDIQGNMS